MPRRLHLPLSFLLVLGAACADDAGDKADSAAPPDPTPTTSATDAGLVTACLAERWVSQTCAGCHLEGSHLDLRFDALETLLTTDREFHPGPIVIPGDPDASLLVRKVEAKVGLVTLEPDEGEPMPLDTQITVDDAQLIRDWVAAGAPLPIGC